MASLNDGQPISQSDYTSRHNGHSITTSSSTTDAQVGEEASLNPDSQFLYYEWLNPVRSIVSFAGNTDNIQNVAWHPSEYILALAGYGAQSSGVYIMDYRNPSAPTITPILDGTWDSDRVSWSPDGTYLAFSSQKSSTFGTYLLSFNSDFTSANIVVPPNQGLNDSTGNSRGAQWSADGLWLIGTQRLQNSTHRVHLWEKVNGALVHRYTLDVGVGGTTGPLTLEFSADDYIFFTTSTNQFLTYKLNRTTKTIEVATMTFDSFPAEEIAEVVYSPDMTTISLFGYDTGYYYIYRRNTATSFTLVKTITVSDNYGFSGVFSKDGKYFFAFQYAEPIVEQYLVLGDSYIRDGQLNGDGNYQAWLGASISYDGRYLATGPDSYGSSIQIWETTGSKKYT